MPKTRVQKQGTVEQLTKAFKESKSAAFADYQGMKVAAVTNLRKQLHAQKVEYMVAKKTLLSLAAKKAGLDVNFKSYPGMLGVAFAFEDEMAPAKLIGDASKENPIKLIGGWFEGKLIGQNEIITLSKLPSKSELMASLLRVMSGPAAAFVRLLNAYKEKQETVGA